MIGSVTFDAQGQSQSLRLTTAAIMRVEDQFDCGFTKLAETLQTAPEIRVMVAIFASGLGDGKGVDRAEAADVIDAIGGIDKAAVYLTEAMEKAFPEAQAAAGNGKGPAKK